MKRIKDTDFEVESLREGLKPLTDKVTPPEDLSAEAVLGTAPEKKKKRRRVKAVLIRTVAVAAAVALAFTGVYGAFRLRDRPRVRKIPEIIAGAETPLSGNTEKTIVDYFTALKADYNENNKNFFGRVVMKSAVEDRAVYNESADFAEESALFDMATGSSDHGSTNNQVAGVDEYDILKNDGSYLYIINDNVLRIVDVRDPKFLSVAASIDLSEKKSSDGYENAVGLYVTGDTAIALTARVDYGKSLRETVIRVYDIKDRTSPKLIKTFSQEGDFFSSRLTGSKLITLSMKYNTIYDIETKGGYVKFEDVVPSVSVDGGEPDCINPALITIMPDADDRGDASFLVLSSLDLDDPAGIKTDVSAVLGSGGNVYCNDTALYVASSVYGGGGNGSFFMAYDSTTRIYAFDITGSCPTLKCDGTVKGAIHNQFSLDEHGGYFRIATTYYDSKGMTRNLVSVLDGKLKTVGEVDDIAVGEEIQSVRFLGDYGYVVTFERTDPLFVIDFTSPAAPKVVGEVKLPGFSSYLHPMDGYIVGIGPDGDEEGRNEDLKVSLFDVSDPPRPREADKIVIKNAYTDVGYDHKTVMIKESDSIIGFPYGQNVYSGRGNWVGTDGKFMVIRVGGGKLVEEAVFTNYSDEEIKEKTRTVYTPEGTDEYEVAVDYAVPETDITRGTYVGDTLFTIGGGRICSYPLTGGALLGKIDMK